MTNPISAVAIEVSEEKVVKKDEENKTQSKVYSTTKHSKDTSVGGWMNSPLSGDNTTGSETNFAGMMGNKGKINAEKSTRQMNYYNLQNNADIGAAYYGWPPGINPMRFPTLIYPHSFFGFAPSVAWMPRDSDASGQATRIEKIDRKKESNRNDSDKVNSNVHEFQRDSTSRAVYASAKLREISKSNISEDEGLVLDERETLKRRKEHERNQSQLSERVKTAAERCSVIEKNISIHAKQSVITHAKSTEQEQSKTAKRGRASTRQIEKTEQYWDRRKKNNVSAKKSRDARRQRETITNQRSAMLDAENLRLRAELATLRDENARLVQELNKHKAKKI